MLAVTAHLDTSVYLRALQIARPACYRTPVLASAICRALKHSVQQSSRLSLCNAHKLRAAKSIHVDSELRTSHPALSSLADRGSAVYTATEQPYDRNTVAVRPAPTAARVADAPLLLKQAVARGNVGQAAQIYQDVLASGICIPTSTSEPLLKLFCQANWFGPAWAVYGELQGDGSVLPYSVYQAVLTTAVQVGELQAALKVFRDLQASDLQPNILTYCAVISALGKQRRRGKPFANQAYELWKELHQSGLPLDAAAYRTGMNACIGVSKPEEARQLLADMRAAGIQPDTRAFNILLKGHARFGDVSTLPALLEEMRDADVWPSAITNNTLIDAYVRAGWVDEAWRCLEEAQRAGVTLDVWSYSTLIKGYVQQGSLGAAMDVMQEMRQQGIVPNEVSYTTLINGFVGRGEVGRGEALLADMRAQGLQPNVVSYNALLKGYAKDDTKTLAEALAVLREMGGVGLLPTVDTFNTLMEACVRRSDVPAALRLFRKILQNGYTPDAVSYTTLIMAFASVDRTDDAVQAFLEMRGDPRVTVDAAAWNAAIDALARVGRMSEAEAYLAQLVAEARQRGWAPPVEAFTSVMQGYARLWQLEPALQLLKSFSEQGGTPDAQMFDALIDLCVRTGSFKRALQVVRAMERSGGVVDKERIRRLLAEVHRQQSAARQRSGQRRGANEHLERFKFWLGLPNAYYSRDWRE